MEIDIDLIEYVKLSNVDDIGRVFTYKGHIYRGIYRNSCGNIKRLFESGLVKELIQKKLIPNTWITDLYTDDYPLIIESEKIYPVTYYTEWPAEQIYDAAKLVLEISDVVGKYGYSLKDCHPYNILYSGGKLLWCDLGSITKGGTFPLQEFTTFYGVPLRLINKRPFFARCMIRMKHYPDMYDLGSTYFGGIVVPKLLCKIFGRINFKLASRFHIYEKILKKIIVCNANVPVTEWSEYQDFSLDDVFENNISERFSRFSYIENLIDRLKPNTVFEFAANRGILACFLASKEYITRYVASDYDEFAVNELYKYIKNSKMTPCKKIVPLVVDFSEEHHHVNLPALYERVKSDLVIACAVTHHLLLTQGININVLFEKIKTYTYKYLIIEFMPLGLWDGKNAPKIPKYYTLDWFKRHMSRYFDILLEEKVEENRIILLGEIK